MLTLEILLGVLLVSLFVLVILFIMLAIEKAKEKKAIALRKQQKETCSKLFDMDELFE